VAVEMAQFLLKLLLKQRVLAVHHDSHLLLVATKMLTAKLHSRYVVKSKFLKGRSPKILEARCPSQSRTFHFRLTKPDWQIVYYL